MDIRLNRHNGKNIIVINSYSPHMGYDTETINKYWYGVNSHFNNISGNRYKWRLCDNNGLAASNNENNKRIGKWAYNNNIETGSDGNYINTCLANNLKCLNTFLYIKRKQSYLLTWYGNRLNVANQIDFIACDEKSAKWGQSISNKIANIIQPYQQKIVCAIIKLIPHTNYTNNINKNST